jgi:uncharacterized protein YcbX
MRVSSLHVYPLKSTAAIDREMFEIEARGLRDDRRWMAIDPDGRFVTGRQHGEMVLIRADPEADGLWLSAPGMPDLHVLAPSTDAPRAMATVWGSEVDAACAGADADAWLSAYLKRPVRLVHIDARSHRAVDPAYSRAGDEVSFADGYPLLAISQSSLDALNARILASNDRAGHEREPLSMARFRPNVVIEGSAAHAEDGWRRVRIGDVVLDAVKVCTRCVFTTVDPLTGLRDDDGEPLNTLKTYRRTASGITFGMNLIPRSGGMLRVGDAIDVLG